MAEHADQFIHLYHTIKRLHETRKHASRDGKRVIDDDINGNIDMMVTALGQIPWDMVDERYLIFKEAVKYVKSPVINDQFNKIEDQIRRHYSEKAATWAKNAIHLKNSSSEILGILGKWAPLYDTLTGRLIVISALASIEQMLTSLSPHYHLIITTFYSGFYVDLVQINAYLEGVQFEDDDDEQQRKSIISIFRNTEKLMYHLIWTQYLYMYDDPNTRHNDLFPPQNERLYNIQNLMELMSKYMLLKDAKIPENVGRLVYFGDIHRKAKDMFERTYEASSEIRANLIVVNKNPEDEHAKDKIEELLLVNKEKNNISPYMCDIARNALYGMSDHMARWENVLS